MSEEEKKEEECPECSLSIGLGMSINICKNAKEVDLDCDEIYDKVVKGEMSTEEGFAKIKEAFKDRPEHDRLELIDKLMHNINEEVEEE